MRGAIPPFPNMPVWCGAQLKHMDDFTFYLIIDTNISIFVKSGMNCMPLENTD